MKASIIIRTYNEEKYLPRLLESISSQVCNQFEFDIIIVDSGSTDNTVNIAKSFDVCVVSIRKEDFSFGRSLNVGIKASSGEIIVLISGHCVPYDENWLGNLISPILENKVSLSYGRQIGGDSTKFSEHELFLKFYPKTSQIPQTGIFCNNANAALLRSSWAKFKYNEQLTGLEDMAMAMDLTKTGEKIGYVANSVVYHFHEESMKKIKLRYEREAIAMRYIMPQVHFSFFDFINFSIKAVYFDFVSALRQKCLIKNIPEIILFRLMQFYGTYKGHRDHRKLSREQKFEYFYPK